MKLQILASTFVLLGARTDAFQGSNNIIGNDRVMETTTALSAESSMDRRNFGKAIIAGVATIGLIPGPDGKPMMGGTVSHPPVANAEVFMDPAMYGDQELRVGAVDSTRESVRRAILKNPPLAPSFYILSLLDGLSFNAAKNKFGPNGNVIYAVLASKDDSEYTRNLQEAAKVLVQTESNLKKKMAISIGDIVAIGGAEAIESIGGPVLPVQLGRLEVAKKDVVLSPLPIDILSGNAPLSEVRDAFKNAGLTEREMTALLLALLTLQRVEKTIPTEDWKASAKPKYVERGKMGRMSDYKMLTDEDIKAALNDEYDEDPDDGWYIADSFGTRDDRFGNRIAKEVINEGNFNKFIQDLNKYFYKRKGENEFGWVADQVLDSDNPTAVAWMKKYADSNLSYLKDLKIAYNSVTQLGAVYTGGKYESLLKNKPRKSLNDDDLNLGF